jgi:hypothetical protein
MMMAVKFSPNVKTNSTNTVAYKIGNVASTSGLWVAIT